MTCNIFWQPFLSMLSLRPPVVFATISTWTVGFFDFGTVSCRSVIRAMNLERYDGFDLLYH